MPRRSNQAGGVILDTLTAVLGAKKALVGRGEPTWPSKRLNKGHVGERVGFAPAPIKPNARWGVTEDTLGAMTERDAGGIRTLSGPVDSVSYRLHIAADATVADNAVGHCPPLPADPLAAAAAVRNLLRPLGQLQRAPANHCRLQLEVGLHVHPELRRRLEELREPQRRIGGYPSLAPHELIEAHGRHPQRLGRRGLRHLERLQELLEKNLARVNRRSQAGRITRDALSGSPRNKRRAHHAPPTET